jgi:hypothetical protein
MVNELYGCCIVANLLYFLNNKKTNDKREKNEKNK